MSQPPYGPPGPPNPQQYPQQPPQYAQQPPQYAPQQQYPPYQQPGPPRFGPPPQQGPGFGWGPTFGPGPGGPGWPPPRKKSKAPLIAILTIAVVGIVGVTLISLVKKAADDVTTPPVTRTRYTPSPTASPTDSPTEQPSSTSTSGSPNQASDAAITAKNKLYTVGRMPGVNCKEPKVRPTTTKNAAAYWAALKPCIDKSWKPLVEKAGYTFDPPQMSYWSGTTVSNPCGGGAINVPFYCSANNMLYMKVDVFVKAYTEYPGDPIGQAYARMWYSRSLAHEFGHGVQNMTGILQAASKLRYEQQDYSGQMRMTRRMELQANCFAGVFLAANKASYPISGNLLYVWKKYVVTAGDKPEEGDHGSVASQGRFMGKSFNTGDPGSCNTFAASAANVS